MQDSSTVQAEIDIFKQISVACHVECGFEAKNNCDFSIQLYPDLCVPREVISL